MENKRVHEGEQLKKLLKGGDKKMEEYAELLKMSKQNMYHHFRKPVLDDDFRRLVLELLGIDFTKVNPSDNKKIDKSKPTDTGGSQNRLKQIEEYFTHIGQLIREDGDFSDLDKEEEEALKRLSDAKIAFLKATLKKLRDKK